ncbi:DoxX family protein [Streptomyces indicus]|uniref:DoxX-like family protein n=1 Tax=Streptomyces indicus TaxID=417292 RepID=A0A1G9EEE7_9ACTN|nr:DoxX family protein [Streptomyces indicus]SDK74530.1 DoxX-like family protein [Streptomyces indicus]
MHVTLWIITALLAAAYFFGGAGKLVLAKERIAAFGPSAEWVHDFSAAGVKGIGAVEVLAAVGLILPAVTGIAPVLVPTAAVGLVLLMAGAAVVRFRRGEMKLVAVDLVYLVLAAFVAWGRFGPEAFTA